MPFDVALVTPSLNRPQWHEQLYEQFKKQVGLASKRLYVLDESAEPSPFFSQAREGVTYVQQAGKPRVDGVTRIGEARNALNALVKEPIIVHVDDDDLLDPLYCATLLDRLGDADVAKLDVWRLIKDDDSVVFEWDTRTFGGQHFAMRGNVVEPVNIAPGDMTPEEQQAYADAYHDGYGWSLVYRKSIWDRVKFPVEGTEDIPWLRAVRAAGGKIRFISDLPHLALHVVHVDPNHGEGGSPHFPQRVLGKLRGAVKERMLGAGAPMQELPQGKAIEIQPGAQYDVIALLKSSHSLREITTRAAAWGIAVQQAIDNVDPAANGVAAPPSGYRLVRVSGVGDKKVTLPWAAPKMLRVLGEKSAIERAWVGAGSPADEDDVMFARVFIGAGTLGPRGRDVGEAKGWGPGKAEMSPEDAAVTEYDPERYKGRPPPHRCSAASSSGIARQIDPRWTYVSSPASIPASAVKKYVEVQTPTAKKTIPTWSVGDLLVLQCPYTGELFAFSKQPARIGAGVTIDPAQFQAQLKAQFTQQGTDYLLKQVPPEVKNNSQWTVVLGDIAAGNYAQAGIDGEILLLSAYGGPPGIALGALIGAIELIYGNDHPAPCTITGCGSTFGLPECAGFPDGRSPFTWASIASMGPAPPPPSEQNGKIPGTWLDNWSDPYWVMPSGVPQPDKPGGPGSFEAGLEAALLSAWDSHATAPWLCKAMQDAGLNGVIYFGGQGNETAIWKMLFAYAGSLVPAFVAGWNDTHSLGTIQLEENGTPASCAARGGTYTQYPGGSGSGCRGPAPQRKVTYGPWPAGLSASGLSQGDPLNAAFYGLALLAGLPPDASISVMINGGAAVNPGAGQTLEGGGASKGASGLAVAGVVVGAAVVAAAGVGVWAYVEGMGYGEAWRRLLGIAQEQTTASGKLLASANPQRLVLKRS